MTIVALVIPTATVIIMAMIARLDPACNGRPLSDLRRALRPVGEVTLVTRERERGPETPPLPQATGCEASRIHSGERSEGVRGGHDAVSP